MEQSILPPPSPVNEDPEDIDLNCTDHSQAAANMNLDQLYDLTLPSILDEMLINDSRDAPWSLEGLNLVEDTGGTSQEFNHHTPSRPSSQQKSKRPVHTRNPLYVTNTLNKSLFNEGPRFKKQRTPLSISPASNSHQSLASTRAPSPRETREQSDVVMAYTPSPALDIYAPSIQDEFQANHMNESAYQMDGFSFNTAASNPNEVPIDVNDMLPNPGNLAKSIGTNEDLDIADYLLDTPILDDYTTGEDVNSHDAILQFQAPNEFFRDQNIEFVDTPNLAATTATDDMSSNFEIPSEYSTLEIFDLLDISHDLVDSNFGNLEQPCSNTSHTIDPLLYVEQGTRLADHGDVIRINDESNFEKDRDAVSTASKATDDGNANFEAPSQGSGEAPTFSSAQDMSSNDVYILNKEKTALVSTNWIDVDTQELLDLITEEANEAQCEPFTEEMQSDGIEEPNEVQGELSPDESMDCLEFLSESLEDGIEEPRKELEESQGESLAGPMYPNTALEFRVSGQILGVRKAKKTALENSWYAILPNLENKSLYGSIGKYASQEAAARVRDLVALKLELHLQDENFKLNFPISDYEEDLEEMKKWSKDDYLWSFERQSMGFNHSKSGLKGVQSSHPKNPASSDAWEAVIFNKCGVIKGYKSMVYIDHHPSKEILGIFADLTNLHLGGWRFVTNFRRGHYTADDVQKFVSLLEAKKVKEAYTWDLIKRVLKEPLPFNAYAQICPQISKPDAEGATSDSTGSLEGGAPQNLVTGTCVAKLNPRDMANHFMKCPWAQLDESWATYRKPSDDCDLEFENTMIHTYGGSNWSPTSVKAHSLDCLVNKEYKFYFPCIVAAEFADAAVQRRILGLDYRQYLNDVPQTVSKESSEQQWVNLPNIRYLDSSFYDVIACDGGLVAVKKDEILSDQVQNDSVIIVSNPLTYDIKCLPPIPYKVLQPRTARLIFYDNTRTTYCLVVVGGSHCKEARGDGVQMIRSTQICLVIYCSMKESWIHFEHVLNAAPPLAKLGHSGIVVHGCSIYYGGRQIIPKKKRCPPKPVIFYFNIDSARRQQLIIDFSKAGNMCFIKVVEPPKLVQVGLSTKIYAVSKQAQPQKSPDILFITEVVVDEDGAPTGSYKFISEGIMPRDLYTTLFRKTNETEGTHKLSYDEKMPPWEVVASFEHIAIKVVGFDPFIALYNVKDKKWNSTYFPYTESTPTRSNIKAWRLIPGVYEPRWNAVP